MNWPLLGLVMLGGALGAAARYLAGEWLLARAAGGWPLGTLAINLAGAFAAGLVFAWLEGRGPSAQHWRAFLLVGILGAMTTFSALVLEALLLTRDGRAGAAAGYLAASLAGGLVLVWLGAQVGAWWRGAA